MKKLALIISGIVFCTVLYAQSEINNLVIDEMIDEEIILGYCDREGLTSNQFNAWFQPEYDDYEVSQEILDKLDTDVLSEVEVTVVLGTWCSDSQREVPRFYKIMDYLNFDNLTVIGVNRAKKADGTEVNEINIELVPTFIFYYEGREIGRIIESPTESLEKDIDKIISSI